MIDSTDIDCLDESKSEFYKILKNEELKNSIVLIYANKQDIPNSKNVADLIQIYNFDRIKTHMWHIQPCSAKTGEGLMAGLKWLSDQLIYKKNTRFPNNPYLVESNKHINIDYNKIELDSMRSNSVNMSTNTISEELKKNIEELDNDISVNINSNK